MSNHGVDVMVLHSMISAAEQSRVFKKPRSQLFHVAATAALPHCCIHIPAFTDYAYLGSETPLRHHC